MREKYIFVYMASSTYQIISKEVEIRVFRHNSIFRHTWMYKHTDKVVEL